MIKNIRKVCQFIALPLYLVITFWGKTPQLNWPEFGLSVVLIILFVLGLDDEEGRPA